MVIGQRQDLRELNSLRLVEGEIEDPHVIDLHRPPGEQIEPDAERLHPARRQVVNLENELRPLRREGT